MEKNVALLVVDLQNDFCPGGSLAVKDGNEIVSIINDLFPLFKTVIFTKDWHPADCNSFASQHEGFNPFTPKDGDMLWPDHCVQNTPGADLHPGIQFGQISETSTYSRRGSIETTTLTRDSMERNWQNS